MSYRTLAEGYVTRSDLPSNLAGVAPGQEVVVEGIVLELVRGTCHDLGISVGDRLRVEKRSTEEVMVRTGTGRPVRIASPYAVFIRVDRLRGTDDASPEVRGDLQRPTA